MTLNIVRNDILSAADAVHEWQSAIGFLDVALADAAQVREQLANAEAAIAVYEANAPLTTEGKNEAECKARLTVALSEQVAYLDLVQEARQAQKRVREAE